MVEAKPWLEEIHYFRIPVTDLDDSVRWYVDVLRLVLRRKTNERAVFEIGGGPLLVLVKADPQSRGHFYVDGSPEFSVGFTCPDIHRFREHLVRHDVSVELMQEEGDHFYFHFYDPSGNKLQAHW
ncbi:VOC family protein [Paenibacillus sp. GD4]|jgi:extradiol dioxygenase family protein|uniref:VOC family protein n=1 Tax=Paenibacillus sp. GD4 TaxID=3068890 RepID=UPI002796A071|nr:VOC family protein [Paenibacillus sp. GD4]MDQ1909688.1 VOC family protein [Paenibacillus sp. GD4]